MDNAAAVQPIKTFLIDISGFIPENITGAFSNSFAGETCTDAGSAERLFTHVRNKFCSIGKWEIFAGREKAHFTLTDSSGVELNRFPQEGDYIRIELPAFKNSAGQGYDWVRIHKVEEDKHDLIRFMKIEVKPVSCPLNNYKCIAHFFGAGASSTFLLLQLEDKVQVSIHGRNEKTNYTHAGLLNLLRNFIVSKGGILGGSKLQWQSLVNGLITIDKKV